MIQINQNYIPSFKQDKAHNSKSAKFAPIKPEYIKDVLESHGFDLVHLKSSTAKKAENSAHQTTVARYRSRSNFELSGMHFDLIFKVPHLYGSMQGVLGLFRGICANQLNVGTHFNNVKIKHVGDPLNELNNLIPELVAQQNKLVETVQRMQLTNLDSSQIKNFINEVAKERLAKVDNIKSVNIPDLGVTRRVEDTKTDLFTVYNVVQENLIRYGLKYTTEQVINNKLVVRNCKARALNEQGLSALEFNGIIWDKASELIAA